MTHRQGIKRDSFRLQANVGVVLKHLGRDVSCNRHDRSIARLHFPHSKALLDPPVFNVPETPLATRASNRSAVESLQPEGIP
jgi:hypothetical protein